MSEDHIGTRDGVVTSYVGPNAVSIFQCITVKHAIAFYAETGMKVNRAYTPKNMRLCVEGITGKKFKARDYDGMVQALEDKIKELRAIVPVRESQ